MLTKLNVENNIVQLHYSFSYTVIGEGSARNSKNTHLKQKSIETAFMLSRRCGNSVLNIMVVKARCLCYIMIFVQQNKTFKNNNQHYFQKRLNYSSIILNPTLNNNCNFPVTMS